MKQWEIKSAADHLKEKGVKERIRSYLEFENSGVKSTGINLLDKNGGLHCGCFYMLEKEGDYFCDSATTLALNVARQGQIVFYMPTHLIESHFVKHLEEKLVADEKSILENKIAVFDWESYVRKERDSSPKTFRRCLSLLAKQLKKPFVFIIEDFESFRLYENNRDFVFKTPNDVKIFLIEMANAFNMPFVAFADTLNPREDFELLAFDRAKKFDR